MWITEREIKSTVRNIPDFPKKGIVFRDITPLLRDAKIFQLIVRELAERFKGKKVDAVLGVEARGFIFGSALAFLLGVPFIPARKIGKLPWRSIRETYSLEYGVDGLEVHEDAVKKGDAVLIIDDLLATGGTAAAAVRVVERLGGSVAGIGFIIELSFLKGMEKIKGYDVVTLCNYESE